MAETATLVDVCLPGLRLGQSAHRGACNTLTDLTGVKAMSPQCAQVIRFGLAASMLFCNFPGKQHFIGKSC